MTAIKVNTCGADMSATAAWSTQLKLNDGQAFTHDLAFGVFRKRFDFAKLLKRVQTLAGQGSKAYEANDAFAVIPFSKGDNIGLAVASVVTADPGVTAFATTPVKISAEDGVSTNLFAALDCKVVGNSQSATQRFAAANGAIVLTVIGDGTTTNILKGTGFLEVSVPITPMVVSAKANAQ